MAKRGGLGKGLDALFLDNEAETGSTLMTLGLAEIEPNRDQPRKNFTPEELTELADSITEHGVLQPIVVRSTPGGSYQIIAGERRWRAARQAGLSEIPAIVIEADDRKVQELALIENLQREDLNPIEEAEGYRALIDTYHMKQEEAAEQVGKSRSAVTNALRLLSLGEPVRQMLLDGRLTVGHARALLPLGDNLQEKTAEADVSGGLNVRQTEALVKRLTSKKPEKPKKDELFETYAADAAGKLTETLGRTVKIVNGRRKGRIELEYYGVDDLNDLLDALAAIKKTNHGGAGRK